MRNIGVRTQLLFSFLLVIVALGTLCGIFSYHNIKSNVVRRAQDQVKNDLKSARAVYDGELREMGKSFELLSYINDPARIKAQLGLDYLFVIETGAKNSIKSGIVRRAFMGNGNGGTRIIDSAELMAMGENVFRQARIDLRSTPKAHPTNKSVLSGALAMEYAKPFFNSDGTVARVMYGGKIVNRYFSLIDRIHDQVYDSKVYHSKPMGTVTIFMDDVRIATNVPDQNGERAIGTRVSAQVYDNVVKNGKGWFDRAFVVADWYLTAYEPIRDVDGNIAGIFYVGILEQQFTDLIHSTLLWYLVIIGIAALGAGTLSFFLADGIARPLTKIVAATDTIAGGDLSHRVQTASSVSELNHLAQSFNKMAEKIHKRDLSLREKNDELAVLNKRYLDLVSMVSHELKGILSSAMLNAYSLRDGYLGTVNETQGKALESITRNLEYFDMTVKNFFNLSRIEKDELSLTIVPLKLKEEIVDESVNYFSRQAQDRGMTIENRVTPNMVVTADNFLLLMVMNNLLGNAIKYGDEKGRIVVRSRHLDAAVAIEVYNDGRPLTAADQEKLFKRFSRLDATPEGKRMRGTGLGLFLCRQIVEYHGGSISCEPRDTGNAFVIILPFRQDVILENQEDKGSGAQTVLPA